MTATDPAQNELARVHVWVRGRVQGVGFRAFVAYTARQLNLHGWVRNVGYDTVEALAEGSQVDVLQFVQAMKTGPRSSYIDDSRVEQETHTGEFPDFEIHASR
jgi:acylphosphatase